jgi:deoxyadenosine/deoxycytidine kinase
MSDSFPYRYIAIEGNIGAGKTSFCELMSKELNLSLILEEFDDNPFLPYFYKNPDRYAFTVELFFMTERYKQLQRSLVVHDMFNDFILSDYFFMKTLLFARKNLKEDEYKMFQKLYNALSGSFPQPDLLVYFHRNIDILKSNIRKRGRDYEVFITPEYLQKIQDSYFEYFRNVLTFPVLIIDLDQINFVDNSKHYEHVKSLLKKKYNPGVHRVSLSV